jgi:release factor glutamine methyltransferase
MQKQQLSYQMHVTDISATALETAKQNFMQFGDSTQIMQQVRFLQMNLLSELPPSTFDVIVANLPYLPSASLEFLDESVRDFEPHRALDGGADGFVLINQLLEQIWQGQFLRKTGKIFLEVDVSHTLDFLQNEYPDLLNRFAITPHFDQFARHRFLVLELL